MIPVFYSTSCEDWTAVEDSSWWGFKAYNSPFCIRGAVMGFLKISLSRKDFKTKENREQSLIPFLLKTFLSLSYLLHYLMSKVLFGEASKHRNNKKRKKKIKQKRKWEGNFDVKLYTVNFFWVRIKTTLGKGLGDAPPPLFIFKVKFKKMSCWVI